MLLKGVRIVEFAGIGPGPFAGQLLADLGADVIVIDRPTRGAIALENGVDRRGKRSVVVDLKSAQGAGVALKIVATCDALIEGNRPGVMERLGLGPADCHAVNPALVYGRMTGWGQGGPYAAMAGHDINYIGLTGALHAMGARDRPPDPPLNLLGDFGGGSLFLVMGMLAALLEARTSGCGRVVDAAICDGVNSMMGMFHGLHSAGYWQPERGANWLDGAAPYYRCYRTSDDRFMAVGCIEPQFFAALLDRLGLNAEIFGAQYEKSLHGRQSALLESIFASRTMADWTGLFDGTDACVTPVLTYREVHDHPHMAARQALQEVNGVNHPAVAPVIDGASPGQVGETPRDGQQTNEILTEIGLNRQEIAALHATGAVRRL